MQKKCRFRIKIPLFFGFRRGSVRKILTAVLRTGDSVDLQSPAVSGQKPVLPVLRIGPSFDCNILERDVLNAGKTDCGIENRRSVIPGNAFRRPLFVFSVEFQLEIVKDHITDFSAATCQDIAGAGDPPPPVPEIDSLQITGNPNNYTPEIQQRYRYLSYLNSYKHSTHQLPLEFGSLNNLLFTLHFQYNYLGIGKFE